MSYSIFLWNLERAGFFVPLLFKFTACCCVLYLYLYICIFAVVFLLLCEIGLYGLKSNMYLIIYVFIDIQEYDTTDARKICFINLYFFPLMSIWCNQILWASHIDCYTWLGQRFFDWLIRMNIGHILCNYHSTTHQACSAQRVLAWIAIFFVTNIGNFGKCLQAPSLLNTLLVFIECLASFFLIRKTSSIYTYWYPWDIMVFFRSPWVCI